MIVLLLLLIPLLGALISYYSESSRVGKWVLPAAAVIHAALCGTLIAYPDTLVLASRVTLMADFSGILLLSVTSILFLFVAVYTVCWQPADLELNAAKLGMKPATFAAVMLLLLVTMTLTAVAQNFGVLWVAVEGTTLASAPLINYHRSKGSLEAMWKYLLICSIGIGLALFGTMLISASLYDSHANLNFTNLWFIMASGEFNSAWFKAGFVLCFAGYALKMGLAPFHTWMPDAYGESASPVSAFLSGGLINCALLAVWRLQQIVPDSMWDFSTGYLKFFGFFSLAVAAFFIVRQKDFKRMLAYSSVEHMGIIALLTAYDQQDYAVLHMVVHSLLKTGLFLVAGNIFLSYGTQSVSLVRGVFARLPENGALWLAGVIFLCGTPPSPLFFTELALVKAAGIWAGAAILLLLLIIFCGMSYTVLKMLSPGEAVSPDKRSDRLGRIPAFMLLLVTLVGILVSWKQLG